MDTNELIREIERLPLAGQLEVYSHLAKKLKRREELAKSLDEIRGIGKGIWKMDAQEYVNKLRADDRF